MNIVKSLSPSPLTQFSVISIAYFHSKFLAPTHYKGVTSIIYGPYITTGILKVNILSQHHICFTLLFVHNTVPERKDLTLSGDVLMIMWSLVRDISAAGTNRSSCTPLSTWWKRSVNKQVSFMKTPQKMGKLSYQFFDDVSGIFNAVDVMLKGPQVVDVDRQHRVQVKEVHLLCQKEYMPLATNA